jgi:cytochrome b6-f complex iron-sulfur subunit
MALASLGIAAVGSVRVLIGYLSPNVLFEPPSRFRAGTPDLYPIDSVTYVSEQQVYILRSPQGLWALSAVCTHLGCITQWKPDANMIACPCHGSKFKRTGDKIEGPAPRPLPRLSLTLTADGELQVDKSETVPENTLLKV